MAAIANLGSSSVPSTVQQRSYRADQRLRSILFDSIRRARMTREDVARRMTQLSGIVVSTNALNNFIAPGRETGRMPAILVPCFCAAVGDDSALRFLLGEELLKLLELGERAAAVLDRRLSEVQPTSATPPTDDREERRA